MIEEKLLSFKKEAMRYARILLLAIILIIVLILFIIGNKFPEFKQHAFSISYSLVASFIFALFYSFIVERITVFATEDNLKKIIKENINQFSGIYDNRINSFLSDINSELVSIKDDITKNMSFYFKETIAKRYYPPSLTADKKFNSNLNESLKNTRTYIFKGVTGRHIYSRLVDAKPQNIDCKILLFHPESNALRLWAKGRKGIADFDGLSTEEILGIIKEHTMMSIVSLFDLREKYRIEIYTYDENIFFRSEILDDGAYISFFTLDIPEPHPATYYYSKDTFYYMTFYKNYLQAIETSKIHLIFSYEKEENYLIEKLKRLAINEPDIKHLRSKYLEFYGHFSSLLHEG